MSDFLVDVMHVTRGIICTRHISQLPERKDWITVGNETFEVKKKIWSYSDRRTVVVIVEEPEE